MLIVRRPDPPQSDRVPAPDGVSPLLWSIYRSRGVSDPVELKRDLDGLLPPRQMAGLDAAVQLLAQALAHDRRVLIVGDFDADGATSCAVGMLALRAFGCRHVDFLVPNRFAFGYGLTPEIVEHARSRDPELLITVDNGISSVAGVATARDLGWQVIVTDHHLPGDTLPDAHAIVNPNLADNGFPSKHLAGVGVIFYVMLGLRARLRASGWFERRGIEQPNLGDLLDLVALGTVADVVALDRNNRILVHQGLARIRAGRCRPGITALLALARRNPARAQASDLGFAAGPRLNAAGRLDDMSLGIRCLLAADEPSAMQLALELDQLNRDRRAIEQGMRQEAERILAQWHPGAEDELPWGLCLYRPDWHQGVVGIVASRIKERYHRPVIVFAAADNGMLKGSARSIKGLHIRDALDQVAKQSPNLLSNFGGHAMAAGLSLPEAAFGEFAVAFDRVVRRCLSEAELAAAVQSDGAVPAAAMNLATAREIAAGGPWGQGFAEPLFDGLFQVVSSRAVGESHWKLVLRPQDGSEVVDAIAFNAVEQWPSLPAVIHAAFRLDENEWQGRCGLQLRLETIDRPQGAPQR